jgi:predicted GIY-YIG superfamily endonuclease
MLGDPGSRAWCAQAQAKGIPLNMIEFPQFPARRFAPTFEVPQWVALNASTIATRLHALRHASLQFNVSLKTHRIAEILDCSIDEVQRAHDELIALGAFSVTTTPSGTRLSINSSPPSNFVGPWSLDHVVQEFADEMCNMHSDDEVCERCFQEDTTSTTVPIRSEHQTRRQHGRTTKSQAQTQVLYRMYNARGELLYVGITGNLTSRLAAHEREKPWWSEVTQILTEHHDSRAQVEAAERAAVIREHPKYNRALPQGVGGRFERSAKRFKYKYTGDEDIVADGRFTYDTNSKGRSRLRIEGTQTVTINGKKITVENRHHRVLENYSIYCCDGELLITKIRTDQ